MRSYFATADHRFPAIHLNNSALTQMRVVGIGSCEVHGAQPSYEEFLACVGKIYPKGAHVVLLEINGGSRMTAGLSEDGSRIPGEELVKLFGTNFGLADGVSVKALIENK